MFCRQLASSSVRTKSIAPNAHGRQVCLVFFMTILGTMFVADVAMAIPSPELVVGSISSVSQLIALVSAMLGGGAAMVGVRARGRNAGGAQSSKGLFRLAMALLVVSVGAIALNIYQFHSNAQFHDARLQATLLRPALKPGAGTRDSELKVMSLTRQGTHPLGMTTNEVANLMNNPAAASSKPLLLLDVRETAENEMGTLPGAKHIRFPDLATSGIDFKAHKTVLLCHNGNRSSETCERMAAMGLDCGFIVGGIEKWIVEGRKFTDPNVRTLSDLRSVPAYAQQRTLLDTPDVRQLVDAEGAIFVDVRYPEEFKSQHLPGAINIPLRKTPTTELMSRIAALPKKPIIAACYDRRGCFGSEVLGLELTRAGHDFRGRYTLPWEYYVPKKRKAHIEAWLKKTQVSWWQSAVNALAGLLTWLSGYMGLVLAIVLVAAVSRLLILPFSWKAEKDQIKANEVADDLANLKERLKDDPKRLGRAIKAFYAEHGLTPLRNLIALAFLPVMAVTLSSVQLAAQEDASPFLWSADLSKPDAVFVLPVLFGLVGGLYLHLALAKTRRHVWYVWLIGFPLLTATAAILSVAGNIYLIASIALLLLQRSFVVGAYDGIPRTFARLSRSWNNWKCRNGIVSLDNADQLVACGNKAYRLAQLRAAGIDVPNGVVLTSAFLDRFVGQSKQKRRRTLDRIWRRLNAQKVVVRSSAAAEDGGDHSFAGVFESVLDVNRMNLEDATREVLSSFRSARAESYGVDGRTGNILVQEMVDAEFAGVLFTRDPEASGLMLIELVEGTADDLVSGLVAPDAYRFGRMTHTGVGTGKPSIDLQPLLEIGHRAEALFGAAQDIEWTYKNGAFRIVQSRDITTGHSNDEVELIRQEEWQRVFDLVRDAETQGVVFEQDETSEVLPQPTPISLSIMQALWASGGSVDLACRRLGLSYDPQEGASSQIQTILGRLYTDRALKLSNTAEMNRATQVQLKKGIEKIDQFFTETFLPEFDRDMRMLEIADFEQLPPADLIRETRDLISDFIAGTHVEVEVINIAASYYMGTARKGLEEAGKDAARLLGGNVQAGPVKFLSDAAQLDPDRRVGALLSTLGHRAVFDYELSEPRYAETPELLERMCGTMTGHGTAADLDEDTIIDVESLEPELAGFVQAARRYQVLKEEAKHESLRQLALIRKALIAVDKQFNLDGLVFYMTIDEIEKLGSPSATEVVVAARDRQKRLAVMAELPSLKTALTLHDLECASSRYDHSGTADDGRCSGTRVAGTRLAEGIARIVSAADARAGADIPGFEDGDVIVCSMVHPAWLPYVVRAGGVVSEVGGWLSHMAIVAREHDIPMVVGAKGLQAISDGDRLRLHPDGLIEQIGEPTEESTPLLAAE